MSTRRFLLAAAFAAMAFTFSCSSGDGKTDSPGGVVPGPSVDYDGEIYQTVKIGRQTWFARNLNHNASGNKCHSNDPANCVKYGRLYDWSTAMKLPSSCNSKSCADQIQPKHQGICPAGWHIPSNADWDELLRYVDGTSGTSSPYSSPTAGRDLKAATGWNQGGNGTDRHGFLALPGGRGNSEGDFHHVGDRSYWWSASEVEDSSDDAYRRVMYYDDEYARLDSGGKSNFFSVRCLKD